MQTNVVVPGSKQIEIGLKITVNAATQAPELFECADEALDSPVLPGSKRRGPSRPDTQDRETRAEESRGEDSLIVGAQDLGAAIPLDGVDQSAEHDQTTLGPKFAQGDARARAMVDDTENGPLSKVVLGIREVERPDPVASHWPRSASADVAPDLGEEMSVMTEDVGDVGLADGLATPVMHVIEGCCDLAAAIVGHACLEPQDFRSHASRLLAMQTMGRFSRQLDVSQRSRVAPGPSTEREQSENDRQACRILGSHRQRADKRPHIFDRR